ncbi:hypothetical protein GCM10010844_41200 [Deinococcus radiotolerans]|uniref:Uncharacterized protein n=1 Tax=Deinococcus radiotolerans TaxID=1309407 RepID=A0ABQ2FQZ1_9DEIO|nr:hypothetical protein GCM10010844_41200 [Deinococcus radiotolerans]
MDLEVQNPVGAQVLAQHANRRRQNVDRVGEWLHCVMKRKQEGALSEEHLETIKVRRTNCGHSLQYWRKSRAGVVST